MLCDEYAAYNLKLKTIRYFENLNDEYSVAYSDAGTTTLKITYDNLKIKNINDYGGMGTRGLRKLYDTFLKLREP